MADTTVYAGGTLVHLVPVGTSVGTKAACATAVAAGFKIGKITAEITVGGDLATTEHKYLADDTEYSSGKPTYGTIPIDTPFSVSDNAGQEKLKDSFANKTRYIMILSNTDGNYTTAPVFVKTANKSYPLEDFVMYKTVLQQNGKETEVIA